MRLMEEPVRQQAPFTSMSASIKFNDIERQAIEQKRQNF